MGKPTDLVAADGQLTWHDSTSLWGSAVPGPRPAATTPLRFPGQYADAETGLNYNVYRYYDPATGRYLSQDPLGLAPAANPVTYVGNPHAEADALGLAPTRKHTKNNGKPRPGRGGHGAANVLGPKNTGKVTKPKAKAKAPRRKAGDPRAPEKAWSRPPFEGDTKNRIRDEKNSPSSKYSGGENDARHIVSFQTMRDGLRNWVDNNYTPGSPEHAAMTKKYDTHLLNMNNKHENLPLGPGDPNTSIGSVVDKFGNVQNGMNNGKLPSEAFDQSSGYLGNVKSEFTESALKAADNIKDPVERQKFMDDVRFSSDFDWPGGDKGGKQFKEYYDIHREFDDLAKNPRNYDSNYVDGLIDRFNNLDRPDGRHPDNDEWANRPKGDDGLGRTDVPDFNGQRTKQDEERMLNGEFGGPGRDTPPR